jgi:hypothetical protein
MERETITITTPIEKHEIVLKSYITGREYRQINTAFMRDVEIEANAKGETPTMKGLKGSAVEEYENAQLKHVVISIDGSLENVLERILDMRIEDYEFIAKKVRNIIGEKETLGGEKKE